MRHMLSHRNNEFSVSLFRWRDAFPLLPLSGSLAASPLVFIERNRSLLNPCTLNRKNENAN